MEEETKRFELAGRSAPKDARLHKNPASLFQKPELGSGHSLICGMRVSRLKPFAECPDQRKKAVL